MPSMVAASSSPNSLLLRLSFNSTPPPATTGSTVSSAAIGVQQQQQQVAQARLRKLRLLCGGPPLHPYARQRCSVAFASRNFAGWSDSDEAPKSSVNSNSHPKNWLPLAGGILGAGVAGLTLLAALTFAAFSLSNRTTSRPKQQMEPLSTHHQVSLLSDYEDDQVLLHKTQEVDNLNLETQSDSHSKLSEEPNENQLDQSNETSTVNGVASTTDSTDAINTPSLEQDLQQDLQHESTFKDMSVAPEGTSPSLNFPDSDTVVSLAAENIPESTSGNEHSLHNTEPADLLPTANLNAAHNSEVPESNAKEKPDALFESSDSTIPESGRKDMSIEPQTSHEDNMNAVTLLSPKVNHDQTETMPVSTERNSSSQEVMSLNENELSDTKSVSASAYPVANDPDLIHNNEINEIRSFIESTTASSSFHSAGIPAPSVVSAALQVLPGKVLVPPVVDQTQGQALAALQVLKVIESDVQPTDLCTRRDYARWLVAASGALSRSMLSKVYPAMYIEGVTELAFDDITPDDPEFSFIQGLAEAGLISSKLSSRDLPSTSVEDKGPINFTPESPLSRQDLVSWKMALEKRQLPEADKKILYQLSGFRDIDKINPDAWPALIADLSAGDQGIISLAFGCIRLFQPYKPVTKAQAAVALATGEASDIVSEELARIEAESVAETAVSAHNALVAQVEHDINASFEKELSFEREKVDAVEKLAEEARHEVERLRAQREEDNIALMKERASIESEMEVLSRLRRELEEQLRSLMSNKVEISYEKERISKLQKEAENEKGQISRLQYELEVERKALSMARAWAEDEAKRAREQAKALEEARDRWERHGIKVVVDSDLREESSTAATWVTAGKQVSVEGSVSRAENLVNKLKLMADNVSGKSREVINRIIQKICFLVSSLKEWISRTGARAKEFQDASVSKARGSVQQLQQSTGEWSMGIKEKARISIQELQQNSAEFGFAVKEGAKRVAEDCREGVEKLAQKFKS